MSKRRSPQPVTVRAVPAQLYRAGCLREWEVASAEPDLAYTEQAFPECPTCPHRVEPEGTLPFCTLRPVGTAHPFAALAGLQLPD
ncbi:hypothetical protein [Deinococcus radiodurans]|uniref:hypothetical protein n=1 Tax=Deinococcus radiodurans TaxID=1299 RepID=UPI00068EF592|nr:hypothetical protein [Deinococcus radiodurans]ANC72318.1 hypothetical protein A2G07_11370 [Deinococcus radiodurans R1 = ATCC 13939 = DSM 20539]